MRPKMSCASPWNAQSVYSSTSARVPCTFSVMFVAFRSSRSDAAAGAAVASIATMPRAIAAALTPMRANGAELDLDALAPYLAFLKDGGIQGVLLLGTTGEG